MDAELHHGAPGKPRLVVGLFAVWCAAGHAVTFDFTKASNDVERAICSQPTLSDLDDNLAEAYSMLPPTPSLHASQRAWIGVRNACKNSECIAATYERRIADLACDAENEAAGSAIGASACATARLRVLDRELNARERASRKTLVAWRAARSVRCREEGSADGGAPGWQSALALACEVKASEVRLAAHRGNSKLSR